MQKELALGWAQKLLAWLVFALLVSSCGINQLSRAPATATATTSVETPRTLSEKTWHDQGYRQIEEGITVVHLKGSEAQIREQYAALLKDEIAAFNEVIRRNRVIQGVTGAGCSNFAVFGRMTADGKVWHGRTFDFYGLGAMDRYKVVYIVEPEGNIPYVSVSWAGWNGYAQVHTAMNGAGISLGYMWGDSNEEQIRDAPVLWELFRRVIANAHTLPEAIEIIQNGRRASAANLLITDAKVPDAVVVEMTSQKVAVRKAANGSIYSTNHFITPKMQEPIKDPNSFARYQRLGNLLEANQGQVNLAKSISFLRDRYDVLTQRENFSGDVIAWNMNVIAVIFSPSEQTLWVAKGLAPAVYSEFVGFSLKDELAGTQANTRLPTMPEDPIIRSQEYQGFLAYQDGYVATLEGNYDRAIERIHAAIPSDPKSGRYRFTLASAYMNLGKYPEAIQAFQEALATDMNEVYQAYSYFRLGKIYEGVGNQEKMKESFAKVLALAIGDPEIEGYARRVLESQK
jgi:tetratricopeptide (TPR) repeat protein